MALEQCGPTQSHRTQPGRFEQKEVPLVCPICGAMVECQRIREKMGWVCLAGGLAHYFQARYGYLKGWFTSGEGNLREPVIQAMTCLHAKRAA